MPDKDHTDSISDTLRSRTASGRNALDRLMLRLPGFRGYIEYTERYTSDRLLRELIAERIIRCKERVGLFMRGLAQRGDIKLLPEVDALTAAMETLVKTAQAADFGASSSFSNSKFRYSSEDQDRLLEYDAGLLSQLEGIEAAVERISEPNADVPASISSIRTLLKNLGSLLNERKLKLLGV